MIGYDYGPLTHVIGVDPGGVTGLCAVLTGPGSTLRARIRSGTVFTGQVDSRPSEADQGLPWWVREAQTQQRIAGKLRDLAWQWGIQAEMHLAIEDFVVRERTMDRSLLSPVRHTAGVLAILESMSDLRVIVHLNSASDAKSVVKDKTLREHQLHRKGMQHSNDAARHALLVLRKESA